MPTSEGAQTDRLFKKIESIVLIGITFTISQVLELAYTVAVGACVKPAVDPPKC